MFKAFITIVILSTSVVASASTIGNTIRDAKGNLAIMNYEEAAAFCDARQARLPTVREFASLSTEMGAKGIRETKYLNLSYNDSAVQREVDANSLDHFWSITKPGPAGEPVIDFYYSHEGYNFQNPEQWSNLWFWTSSVAPDIWARKSWKSMWTWTSGTGSVVSEWRLPDRKLAVRCIFD